MRLRFRVVKPPNNIDASTFSCGTASTPPALNTLSLLIAVNGTTVVNLGVGALNAGTTASVPVGALTATFAVENVNYLRLGLNLANRDDSAEVRIRVVDESSDVYDTTFTIFGFDLGKNPNLTYPGVSGNYVTPFDIKLIPSTFTAPLSSAHKQCAAAFMYRDFLNKKIHVIKSTSSTGIASYYLPGALYPFAVGNYVAIEDPLGKIEGINMVVNDGATSGSTLLAAPALPVTDPILGFSLSNGCLGNSTIITLSNNVGALQDYLVNDGDVHTTYATLHYTIWLVDKVTGLTVATSNFAFSPNPALTEISTVYTPGVPLSYDRQYELFWEVRNVDEDGLLLASTSFILVPCSSTELEKIDCNTWLWTNKQGTATIVVKQMSALGVLTEIQREVDVLTGAVGTLVLSDGVFVIDIIRNGLVAYSYKLVSNCMFINCLTGFTKDVACDDPCVDSTVSTGSEDCGCTDCGGSGSVKDRSAFTLLANTYLALVNKLTIGNYLFLTLDTESAALLQNLALIQDRMSKYCSGCP